MNGINAENVVPRGELCQQRRGFRIRFARPDLRARLRQLVPHGDFLLRTVVPSERSLRPDEVGALRKFAVSPVDHGGGLVEPPR